MINDKYKSRPKWLRVLIGLLFAWASFISTFIILFSILWFFQVKLLNINIEGTPAAIILIILIALAGVNAYLVSKWQFKFLDKKSLLTNYIVLLILVLILLLTIISPMTYLLY